MKRIYGGLLLLTLGLVACTSTKNTTAEETSLVIPNYKSHLQDWETYISSDYRTMVSSGNGQYIKRIFHPEKNQLTALQTYRTADLSIAHGTFKKWTDEGILFEEEQWIDGYPTDEAKYYHHQTGTLSEQGHYFVGRKMGQWQHYHPEGWLHHTLTWNDGKREGSFEVYDSTGAIINHGVYQNDSIVSQQHPQFEPIIRQDYDGVWRKPDEMPTLIVDAVKDKGSNDQNMLHGLVMNVRYPRIARENNIQGQVLMSFVVDEKGMVQDIKAINGNCASLEKEARRVIGVLTPWKPGTVDGKPVKVKFHFPIRFKLS